jgi:hypothetical protein
MGIITRGFERASPTAMAQVAAPTHQSKPTKVPGGIDGGSNLSIDYYKLAYYLLCRS